MSNITFALLLPLEMQPSLNRGLDGSSNTTTLSTTANEHSARITSVIEQVEARGSDPETRYHPTYQEGRNPFVSTVKATDGRSQDLYLEMKSVSS